MRFLEDKDLDLMKEEKSEWRRPSYKGKEYLNASKVFLLTCENCESNFIPDTCPKCGNESFRIDIKPFPTDNPKAAFSCSKCNAYFTEWGCEKCGVHNTVVRSIRILEKEGGCFIATAVYGSYEAKEVVALRSFRDNVLIKSYAGELLVKIYYLVSPFLAMSIRNHGIPKKIVKRFLLDPFVKKITKGVS